MGGPSNPPIVKIPGESQFVIHVNLIPGAATGAGPSLATESGSSYVVKQRTFIDFDLFNLSGTTLKALLCCNGLVPNVGSNGDIRVFNATDAVELGVVNFTELVLTEKFVDLSSLPVSGTKLVEMQMRKPAGTGPGFQIDTAAIILYADAN